MSTAFTVSVDAAHDITTGISAAERALTIRTLADPKATVNDFVQPGHTFPLRAVPGRVLRRAGPYGSHHRPRAHGGPPACRRLL